ncbi:uncharacterized protein LOC143272081 [Peromyscus maniculatus bairdii]|uniref:uncharacterized protein LOC143272081 n=1 Tax=Peromyscus maniculatus bairdii TaxID=230844 RepID=UPI003FD563A7
MKGAPAGASSRGRVPAGTKAELCPPDRAFLRGVGPGRAARGAAAGRVSRIQRSPLPGAGLQPTALPGSPGSRRSRPQAPSNEWAPRPAAATRWRCPPLSARTAPAATGAENKGRPWQLRPGQEKKRRGPRSLTL